MKIFLTGASGFVGGHVAEALARGGHDVRAMARSDRSAELVRGYGATPVRCDLADVRGEHLAGCDAVIHAAARAEEWGTREQFWTANVEGTQAMLDAARSAGVRRFVHVGTEAAIFDGHDLVDVDESAPYPARQRYLYSETKAEAERRVLAASGLDAISIRPRLVWGPRDQSVLPAIVRMAREGSFAWLDGGRRLTSTAHVDNVVRGIALALTRGTPGKAYFVADEGTRTMRAFLTEYARSGAGVELGSKSVPWWLARPAARAIELAWRLFRVQRTPPMTRFAIDMMSSTVTVRTDAAARDLGYAPVITVDEGMRRLASAR